MTSRVIFVPDYEVMHIRGEDIERTAAAVSHFAKLEETLRRRARELRIDDTEQATKAAMRTLLRMARGMIAERPHLGRGYWLDGVAREELLYVGGSGVVVT